MFYVLLIITVCVINIYYISQHPHKHMSVNSAVILG